MKEEVFKSVSSQLIETLLAKVDRNYREVENNTYVLKLNGYNLILIAGDSDIQLLASFRGIRVTLSRINEWNKTKKFTRAYLDKDNNPALESDLDFEGGVTLESIGRFLGIFAASVDIFAKHIS